VAGAVRCGKFYCFTKTAAQKTVDAYPVGQPVDVFYDPEFPEVSVLVRGWHPECLYSLSVFAIACIVETLVVGLLIIRLAS
jgi:hypothetical protein